MTTVRDKLVEIESISAAAILQLDAETQAPPSPAPFAKWAVPQRTLAGEAGYINEPCLVECANGDIVCLYRHGSAHISVGAKLLLKRSTDRGLTWGAAIVVHEVASRDCRNQSIGKDPATGRLIAFSRTSDSASTTYGRWKHISDDNGLTWTTTEFNNAPAGQVSFGPMVETASGLCQLFYGINHIVALFSTDGGATWGNQSTVFQAVQTGAQFCEPTIVAIDANRLVCIMRDNVDGGRYWYTKSADGGLTWSACVQGRWTSAVSTSPAPMNLVLHGDFVFCAFDIRAPHWKQIVTKVEKEAFWTNPLTGWAIGNAQGGITTYVSKIAAGNASGGEYGYVFQVSLLGGVLRAWYDSKTGNGYTETAILVSSN